MSSDVSQSARGWRPLWAVAGVLVLALGIIGIFLPVLPTTPLVLLAAFCFGKGSPQLRRWITAHRTFGPMIDDWEATGAIPAKAKVLACSMMAITFAVCVALALPGRVLMAQAVLMSIGALYVLTRPSR